LIIGAGISGLSLAHALQQNLSRRILVTQRQGRVGGNIKTSKVAEFLWEEGPNSFSPTSALLKLAVDVGLKPELVFADRHLPRYVYWKAQLHPVLMSLPAVVKSHRLDWRGKLRLMQEFWDLWHRQWVLSCPSRETKKQSRSFSAVIWVQKQQSDW
jgi:oxygen-dependent protoporphyrinogen oxidase